jgi:hypothetical protein
MKAPLRIALGILVLVLGLLFLPIVARADDSPDPTGMWIWPRQPWGIMVRLKLEGERLTGVVIRPGGDAEPIQEGKYANGTVTFKARLGQNTISYRGNLKGDTIDGEIRYGGDRRSRTWTAVRVADRSPAGTWKWSLSFDEETIQTTIETTLRLKFDDHNLTGELKEGNRQSVAIKEAKYDEGKLTFNVLFTPSDVSHFEGYLAEDMILGQSGSVTAGRPWTGSRPWRATRTKE